MDRLGFLAETLKCFTGLAWPITILVVVLLFREPLKALIGEVRPKNLKVGKLAIEFGDKLSNVKRKMMDAAVPAAAAQGVPAPAQTEAGTMAADSAWGGTLESYSVHGAPPERTKHRFSTANALHTMVNTNPRSAVLEAWALVEARLRAIAEQAELDVIAMDRAGSTVALLDAVHRNKLLPPSLLHVCGDLRELRNLASGEEAAAVDAAQAHEYVDTALYLIDALDYAAPSRPDGDGT